MIYWQYKLPQIMGTYVYRSPSFIIVCNPIKSEYPIMQITLFLLSTYIM